MTENKAYDAVEIDDIDLERLAKYIHGKERDVSLEGLLVELIRLRVEFHFHRSPNTSETVKKVHCDDIHKKRGSRLKNFLVSALQKGSITRKCFFVSPDPKMWRLSDSTKQRLDDLEKPKTFIAPVQKTAALQKNTVAAVVTKHIAKPPTQTHPPQKAAKPVCNNSYAMSVKSGEQPRFTIKQVASEKSSPALPRGKQQAYSKRPLSKPLTQAEQPYKPVVPAKPVGKAANQPPKGLPQSEPIIPPSAKRAKAAALTHPFLRAFRKSPISAAKTVETETSSRQLPDEGVAVMRQQSTSVESTSAELFLNDLINTTAIILSKQVAATPKPQISNPLVKPQPKPASSPSGRCNHQNKHDAIRRDVGRVSGMGEPGDHFYHQIIYTCNQCGGNWKDYEQQQVKPMINAGAQKPHKR